MVPNLHRDYRAGKILQRYDVQSIVQLDMSIIEPSVLDGPGGRIGLDVRLPLTSYRNYNQHKQKQMYQSNSKISASNPTAHFWAPVHIENIHYRAKPPS
jgi:hypothetical protein